MQKLLSSALIMAFFLAIPAPVLAATATKQPVKKQVTAVAVKKPVVSKSATCVRCKSLAEGTDVKGAKSTSWIGTIIGINDGAEGIIITEARQLNRIKAYSQHYVELTDKTDIVRAEDEKEFNELDIGFRVRVTGSYNAKTRTVVANDIEILEVPAAPVTRTK